MTTADARRVLGIDISYSELELRTAYRLKAKEFHPDIACDNPMAHMHMIKINQAYNLLRSELSKGTSIIETNRSKKGDYELYRKGIDIFERIHPSEWIKVTIDGLFDPSSLVQKDESYIAFQAAIKRISDAYHIFSELIHDFPNSMWVVDARDKIRILDKMIVRYDKMMQNCS